MTYIPRFIVLVLLSIILSTVFTVAIGSKFFDEDISDAFKVKGIVNWFFGIFVGLFLFLWYMTSGLFGGDEDACYRKCASKCY